MSVRLAIIRVLKIYPIIIGFLKRLLMKIQVILEKDICDRKPTRIMDETAQSLWESILWLYREL